MMDVRAPAGSLASSESRTACTVVALAWWVSASTWGQEPVLGPHTDPPTCRPGHRALQPFQSRRGTGRRGLSWRPGAGDESVSRSRGPAASTPNRPGPHPTYQHLQGLRGTTFQRAPPRASTRPALFLEGDFWDESLRATLLHVLQPRPGPPRKGSPLLPPTQEGPAYHADEVSAAVLPRQALLAVVLPDDGAQAAAEHDVSAVRRVPLPAGQKPLGAVGAPARSPRPPWWQKKKKPVFSLNFLIFENSYVPLKIWILICEGFIGIFK